ncbi:MAG: translation initiation factor IF-3 [Candidatus Ancillula sp.]|nr:translation initiation factor IF-3 [Candidatus Ancillula sp.]
MDTVTNAFINEDISSPAVLLIGSKGEQIGKIATSKALEYAQKENLDLVLVAPSANPPVAKILDFGKYKYELEHRQRESRRNQIGADVKEIRFRLKIDQNDFNIKMNSVVKFLKAGDKVKVQIQLRGREQQHPEYGITMLQKVAEIIVDCGTIAAEPTAEGRNISMLISPLNKKELTISEQRRRGSDAKNARAARQAARLAAKGLDASGKKLENKEKGYKDAKK